MPSYGGKDYDDRGNIIGLTGSGSKKYDWNPYTESQATELWNPPKTNTNGSGYTGSSGGSSGGSSSSAYDRYLSEIRRQQREAEAARRRAIDAGVGQLQGQIPLLGQNRDDAARQAYIRAQQGQAGMAQQMAAMGATGGLSETAAMQANAGYQNEQNDIMKMYQNAVAGINNDIASLKANGDLSLVENSDKYLQMIMDVRRQQEEAERSRQAAASTGAASEKRSVADIAKMLELGLMGEDEAREYLGFSANSQRGQLSHIDTNSVLNLGMGPLSEQQLGQLVNMGKLNAKNVNGKIVFTRKTV